ncbi:MAG: 16S rRNA (uracil(1498)-N(3))-methyltransferase [Sphingobacteriaceae bacterium]|nr:16S rRNA (uracil(1498)-N(3))-methyltransferase [Sphingobacteriaceae bacterium]
MNVFIANINGATANLTPEESWHCHKVLRCKAGEQILIIDGLGAFYKGELVTANEKQCIAHIIEGPIYQQKRSYYLHLAIAPTKQIDRIEWMIEKAVEIGVDELSFLKCKNSERVSMKMDRIQKIVESAVKQSKQAFIPKVNPLEEFKKVINGVADIKLIGHCEEEVKVALKDIEFKDKIIIVLIGPEGDFAKDEIDIARTLGYKPLSLGNTRLRTETAGLYVVQALSILT